MNDLDWGKFRRLKPIDDYWGIKRGRPLDRFYIETFLRKHSSDISGRVLEVENPGYSRRFGGSRIQSLEILDIDAANPNATIISDLSKGENIPEAAFDCFILTQTLQLIYDLRGAISSTFRLLKPGGVVLATVPGITPIPRRDSASRAWCWSFTEHSVYKLFSENFGAQNIDVETHGNVLAATSFLWGLAQNDLTTEELKYRDPDYPMIISVRAVKR